MALREQREWLSAEEQRVWRSLLAVQARVIERLDSELRQATGFTLGEFEVLVHLSEAAERSLRMAQLAERVSLTASGLTRRVDSLVRRGLVRRRPCESDGRGAYAELTEAGRAALETTAPVHVAGVRRYLIDALGPTGLERLAGGLATVDRALDAPGTAGTPAGASEHTAP
ncbi:MAG: MarR family winged helix-turn-helix transcriptional regulator [Acidimicrobiales bacterium]